MARPRKNPVQSRDAIYTTWQSAHALTLAMRTSGQDVVLAFSDNCTKCLEGGGGSAHSMDAGSYLASRIEAHADHLAKYRIEFKQRPGYYSATTGDREDSEFIGSPLWRKLMAVEIADWGMVAGEIGQKADLLLSGLPVVSAQCQEVVETPETVEAPVKAFRPMFQLAFGF